MMTRWMIGAAVGLLALAGSTVQAQERPEPEPKPGFDLWGTGEGSYFYHRLSGDCGALEHRHGRNAAWGRWVMPLSAIVVDGPGEDGVGNLVLRLRCSDGTACVESGHLTNITGRASEHAIPFQTVDRARAFERRVADLKTACGVAD